MMAWALQTSVCMSHTSDLIYRSADGLLGLAIHATMGKAQDTRRYFVWDLPDSAPDYPTEAEARAALAEGGGMDMTPGQVAYEAWWHARWPDETPPFFTSYAKLTPPDRRAWEAAAQAVLAMEDAARGASEESDDGE